MWLAAKVLATSIRSATPSRCGSPPTSARGAIEAQVVLAPQLLDQRDFPVEVVLHRLLDLRLPVVGAVVDVVRLAGHTRRARFDRKAGGAPRAGAARERERAPLERRETGEHAV